MTASTHPDRAPDRTDAARASAALFFAGAQVLAGQASRLFGGGRPIEKRALDTDNPAIPFPPAFAIWGPIFAANLAHAARGYARRDQPLIRRTGWYSAAALAGDTAWELWTQYRGMGWRSVAIIAATAGAATAATLVAVRADEDEPSRVLILNSMAPLAGWVTVATAADIGSARITEGGSTGPAAQTRSAVPLALGASAVAATVSYAARGDLRYAGAAGWGLANIALRNAVDRNRPVMLAALAGLAAVAGVTALARRRA